MKQFNYAVYNHEKSGLAFDTIAVMDYVFNHQDLYYVEYLSVYLSVALTTTQKDRMPYKKVRAALKNLIKLQGHLLLPAAVGLDNPAIPSSTSTSISPSGGSPHNDSDVPVVLPTMQKHRMSCML